MSKAHSKPFRQDGIIIILNYGLILSLSEGIMSIESRNSVKLHYFDTKSLIWSQIFFENLSMSIAMNIGKIKFVKI